MRRFAFGLLAVAAMIGALATPAGADDWGSGGPGGGGGGQGRSCTSEMSHNLVGFSNTCSPISIL
ncbi:hypothetical protein I5Q34_25735 [Streptomyces sp. AV19]|uniref:hypothetical protein n=1 Tax=Streptomyces sp. AV19 TaxID=2793068 RepID=UPI0018FE422C|nr:hypothetical protein [Streptomyces sp. AV19]MBH1937630.1 hypothetical protein [Streptomyces sp. AV19]MDG4536299.1 hypothetical protein [Streptomyces sp. AV19]